MKVAYVFISPRAASYKLGQMILPQLDAGTHRVTVVGMFFFDDSVDTLGCFPDLYHSLSGNTPDQVISL